MSLKASLQLNLKLSQSLKLTPQLQLAMKMLQMNHLELSDMIKQEVEQNPLLDVRDGDDTLPESPKDADGDRTTAGDDAIRIEESHPGGADELSMMTRDLPPGSLPKDQVDKDDFQDAWLKYEVENQGSNFGELAAGSWYDPDSESNIEEYVSTKPSLVDHLSMQLRLSSLVGIDRKVGEYLLGAVDRNGYLSYDEESVLTTLGIDFETLDKVVSILQTFDPPGICARNLTECLLLQYQSRSDRNHLAERLVQHYLEDLADNKLKLIAQKEKVSLEDVLEAYQEIKKLDPKPGMHFDHGGENQAQYITPDVFVEIHNGEFELRLNEKYVPSLRINNFYKSQLRLGKLANKKTVKYIKEKINAARFIIESIERRKNTIFNVTKRIFEIQRGFLDLGIKGLKPLTLRMVADHVGLHESTISRVTNSKYVHTSRGVFQLKFFFSSGTTTSSGESVSSKHIQEILQEIVNAENPKKPYSDSKLAQMLKGKGIDIARRTVTKYREELGIRSSSKRKQFA